MEILLDLVIAGQKRTIQRKYRAFVLPQLQDWSLNTKVTYPQIQYQPPAWLTEHNSNFPHIPMTETLVQLAASKLAPNHPNKTTECRKKLTSGVWQFLYEILATCLVCIEYAWKIFPWLWPNFSPRLGTENHNKTVIQKDKYKTNGSEKSKIIVLLCCAT